MSDGDIRFNVNNYVRVRLTDAGRNELRQQVAELNARITANGGKPLDYGCAEVDGWSRWQMWSLMQDLGSLCGPGFDPPFEMEIIIQSAEVTDLRRRIKELEGIIADHSAIAAGEEGY